MATTDTFSGGLQVPVQINGQGGLKLLTADDYIQQIVRVKAGSSESDNPFQERSLGSLAVFKNASDVVWQAQQRHEIEKLFAALEAAQLAKLKTIEMAPSETEEGVFDAKITYLSLETGTVQDMQLGLSRG